MYQLKPIPSPFLLKDLKIQNGLRISSYKYSGPNPVSDGHLLPALFLFQHKLLNNV